MKLIKKLISLHRFPFLTAMLFTCLAVVLSLYWNRLLAVRTCRMRFWVFISRAVLLKATYSFHTKAGIDLLILKSEKDIL